MENRNPRSASSTSHVASLLTRATLANVRKKLRRRAENGSRSVFYDNTVETYSWLLPGWVVEERTLTSGRMYKVYYEPSGECYRTKSEVLDAWEDAGIIVLDL